MWYVWVQHAKLWYRHERADCVAVSILLKWSMQSVHVRQPPKLYLANLEYCNESKLGLETRPFASFYSRSNCWYFRGVFGHISANSNAICAPWLAGGLQQNWRKQEFRRVQQWLFHNQKETSNPANTREYIYTRADVESSLLLCVSFPIWELESDSIMHNYVYDLSDYIWNWIWGRKTYLTKLGSH